MWVINADGTGAEQVASDSESFRALQWTRDGRYAYYRKKCGRASMKDCCLERQGIGNRDETEVVCKYEEGHLDRDLSISSSGRTLYSIRGLRANPAMKIVVTDTRTFEPEDLEGNFDHLSYLAISPDGKQLVYVGQQEGSCSDRLFLRDLETVEERVLFPPTTLYGYGKPCWSASGEHILLPMQHHSDRRKSKLVAFDVDRPENPRTLFEGHCWSATWSSDGAHVFLDSYDESGYCILATSAEGGKAVQRLTGGSQPLWGE